MDAHALTIKTVRDGPACTIILVVTWNFSRRAGSSNRRHWPPMT